MGAPHKHRDVIIAWAEGERIQYRSENGNWVDESDGSPEWYDDFEYRIKPKRVMKEGWVNIAPSRTDFDDGLAGYVTHAYRTKEEAEASKGLLSVATIRIEWEEEV
jgi:hypothetical protein